MGGGVAGAAAVGGGAFGAVQLLGGSGLPSLPATPVLPKAPVRTFHSRPDLRPPRILLTNPRHLDEGYLFVGTWPGVGNQAGALIIDHQGEPVWFYPTSSSAAPGARATSFRPFTYRGEPVLAWMEGQGSVFDFGKGDALIVDRSYRQVARVQAAGGRTMDLHEFQLTPQGTALFTCYPETVPADLRPIGGPRQGSVLSSIFQEVDLRSGRLLMEWRGLDHIPVSDSYVPGNQTNDYLHLNSIAVMPDGNLLVSARHTWALYKLDRRTGQVIWRLGGKRSQFMIDPDARFRWQHDARQPAPGTISLFDNDAYLNAVQPGQWSRGLMLDVDEARRRVSLKQAFNHLPPLSSTGMGNVQVLPSGKVIVGWGTQPYVSEFASSGELLSDLNLLFGVKSYRGFLFPWRATPHRPPDVAVLRSSDSGKTILYASWNGDTETTHWRVQAGDRPNRMRPIGIARRRAFETAIAVGDSGGYFAVAALDHQGRPLGHSAAVRL